MKKIIVLFLILIFVGGLASVAFAAIKPINCPDINCIIKIMIRVANVFLSVVTVVSVFAILYSGFLFMTSGGAEESLDKAKNFLKYAIIGLIIAALAFSVDIVVNSLLTDGGGSASDSPSDNFLPDSGSTDSGSSSGGSIPGAPDTGILPNQLPKEPTLDENNF
ncbi:hypothetical protein HY061_02470 [Candidatus Azambacteria bacterium]|nr:hypothetical protein [Candidatus Azambacteria bacterium]